MARLKSEIISGAFNKLRISGITVQPTAEENELALDILEGMAHEFFSRNICTGYAFEDTPDPNTPSNLDPKYWQSYEWMLAERMLAPFGKEATIALNNGVVRAASFLHSFSARPRENQYPNRMPIGSGNSLRWGRYRRFFSPVAEAPNTCETNTMYIDDVNDFSESFESYLEAGEDISSYTIEADTGLTIVSSSLTTPVVDYQIRADGTSDTQPDSLLRVKIVATTSNSRIETRFIDFELLSSEL